MGTENNGERNPDLGLIENLIERMAKSHEENFKRTAYLNPFEWVYPTDSHLTIPDRFKQTYYVLAGRDLDFNFWKLPPQTLNQSKQGLFSYVLGIPFHLVYSIVPELGILIARLGDVALNAAREMFSNLFDANTPFLAKLLSSPLWLTLSLVGALVGLLLVGVGAMEFYITKAVLWPVNWLVQRPITIVLAGLTAGLLLPIVLAVYYKYSKPEPPKLNNSNNNDPTTSNNPNNNDPKNPGSTSTIILQTKPTPEGQPAVTPLDPSPSSRGLTAGPSPTPHSPTTYAPLPPSAPPTDSHSQKNSKTNPRP